MDAIRPIRVCKSPREHSKGTEPRPGTESQEPRHLQVRKGKNQQSTLPQREAEYSLKKEERNRPQHPGKKCFKERFNLCERGTDSGS